MMTYSSSFHGSHNFLDFEMAHIRPHWRQVEISGAFHQVTGCVRSHGAGAQTHCEASIGEFHTTLDMFVNSYV